MQLSDRISEMLANGAVLTSAQLIDALVKVGMSHDAAKQAISRLSRSGGIWRSTALKLPGGGRLFAMQSSLGRHTFSLRLAEALGGQRPGLTRCLSDLALSGVINRVDAMRVLAVSHQPSQRKSLQEELDALHELGVKRIREGTILESLVLRDQPGDYDDLANERLTELRNAVLASEIILDRFRRNSIVSWGAYERADMEDLVVFFNGQAFSAVGYSYLSPLLIYKAGKSVPCPVLIDCHWRTIGLPQLEGFLERIKRATHRGKTQQRYLAVIAGLDFSGDAFTKAKRSGLMVINIQQDFGSQAMKVIATLQSLMSHIGGTSDDFNSSIDSVSGLLDALHENPIVVEIRSVGFEITCGLILRANGYERVELGRNVPFNDTTRDVDAFGVRGNELRIVEAKAHHGGHSLDPGDVRKFFTETVPSLKKYLRDKHVTFNTCNAQIWTTGPKGQKAQDELDGILRSKPKKDEWGIVAGDKLLNEVPTQVKTRINKLIKSLQIRGRGAVTQIDSSKAGPEVLKGDPASSSDTAEDT